jgi:hypothetical protein
MFGGGCFPNKGEGAGFEGSLHVFLPRIRADEDNCHG